MEIKLLEILIFKDRIRVLKFQVFQLSQLFIDRDQQQNWLIDQQDYFQGYSKIPVCDQMISD